MTDTLPNSTIGSTDGTVNGSRAGGSRSVTPERFAQALAQAQRGEAAGYRWLYDTYAEGVGALARIEAAGDPDALVNSVFAQALASIDRFVGGPAQFAAHLTFLTRFQAVDELRLRNRRVIPDPTDLAPSEPGGVDPDLLHEALDALRPDQREVVILRVLFGLTGDEVAAAIEQPMMTVRALQDGADTRLRTWLDHQRSGR